MEIKQGNIIPQRDGGLQKIIYAENIYGYNKEKCKMEKNIMICGDCVF